MMNYALFTDVSLNPDSKTGLGAFLRVRHTVLDNPPDKIDEMTLRKSMVYRIFTDTSSTKLELQTVLWAIEEHMEHTGISELTLYTDSQCVSGLLKRRKRLEKNNYLSKRTGSLLKHAVMYKSFYALFDKSGFDVVKLTGHIPSKLHSTGQRIFSCVDREVRKQLKSVS